jgi:hypothetical protein
VLHTTWPKAYNCCQSDVSNYDPLSKILVVNLMEYIPTAIWCWAQGGKRTTLQQWRFWFVTCLTATVATNRSYTACTGLLPVANNIRAQMTHS